MKKILLFAAFVISTFGFAAAQTSDAVMAEEMYSQENKGKKTPTERAEALTAWMTKKLTLSAEQTEKIRSINLGKAQEIEALRNQYTLAQKNEFREAVKAIRASADAEYKAVLTPDQYGRLQDVKQQKQQKKKQGRGKGPRK